MNTYTVTIIAQPEPMLVARIAVLLRKYNVDLRSLERSAVRKDGTEQIQLTVRNVRDNMAVAMPKLRRLVPIIELSYELR